MSSFCKCKSYSHFFSKNITVYAIFNDLSFNNMLTNDIVRFEQLGSEFEYVFGPFFIGYSLLHVRFQFHLTDCRDKKSKSCLF